MLLFAGLITPRQPDPSRNSPAEPAVARGRDQGMIQQERPIGGYPWRDATRIAVILPRAAAPSAAAHVNTT